MGLSKRLYALYTSYTDSEDIWDIGCDHGELGLSFRTHPEVKTINLVDPSFDVVNKLRNKINDSDIPEGKIINIHHQKGQNLNIKTETKKCIFIAGMGGDEIVEILNKLKGNLTIKDTIVISPHKNIQQTRRDLNSSGFKLIKEKLIYENNYFYQVLILTTNTLFPNISQYGIEIWQDELGERYRLKELSYLKHHKDALSLDYFAYLNQLRR